MVWGRGGCQLTAASVSRLYPSLTHSLSWFFPDLKTIKKKHPPQIKIQNHLGETGWQYHCGGLPQQALGSPPQLQCYPRQRRFLSEASWTQSILPRPGLELKTASWQREKVWHQRCWGPGKFSLATVAKLISIISSEVAIAPQVQPGTLG